MSGLTIAQHLIVTFTNGYGRWRATIQFPAPQVAIRTADPGDDAVRWPEAYELAREAIVTQILAREKHTKETDHEAWFRVTSSLPRLYVVDRQTDAAGHLRSITWGE